MTNLLLILQIIVGLYISFHQFRNEYNNEAKDKDIFRHFCHFGVI